MAAMGEMCEEIWVRRDWVAGWGVEEEEECGMAATCSAATAWVPRIHRRRGSGEAHANPAVESEQQKPGTRTGHGRLWDGQAEMVRPLPQGRPACF